MYIEVPWRRVRHCLYGTSNQEPFFQPCSHPAASKQQMAGLGTVADLVQSCLLGSNCVLTWRETEYYSHAGKHIIVTSLADRWLYLSHDQMEFEENKLACDAAWTGCTCVCSLCGCIWLFASPSLCLSFYLSVYLFISSTAACLLPHISACLFLFCGRCFSAAGLYIRKGGRGRKSVQVD